jgi:hypothetical protein
MRREDILAELEATLLKAQVLARRDRPLADLPAVRDAADVARQTRQDIRPATLRALGVGSTSAYASNFMENAPARPVGAPGLPPGCGHDVSWVKA